MQSVSVRAFAAPPADRREILRYAGVRGEAPALLPLLEECLAETAEKLVYRVCYRSFPIVEEEGGLDLGFLTTASQTVKTRLAGCRSILLFGATVGIELDRLIARYSRTTPTRALLLDALGAERIEALCDIFCETLAAEKREEGLVLSPRFSPGYGDFPLEAQKEIFRVLEPSRRIGLTLNDSLLMTPSKSVTAIMGMREREE